MCVHELIAMEHAAKKHAEIIFIAPISCENISLALNCAKVPTTLAGAGTSAGPTQIVYQFP